MAKGGDGKVSNSLVAASCAAILAVYTAGYSRTRDAAEKFDAQAHERRPARSERAAAAVQPQDAQVETSTAAAPQRGKEAEVAVARPVESAPSAITEQTSQVTKETPAPVETAIASAPVTAAPVVAATPAPTPVAAPAPTPAPAPPVAAPVGPKWKDGTYTGWGTSRHGDIEARVVVHEGRIVQAGIATCLTRYSCDVIDAIIGQPVQRQAPDVDFVSRATESSDAYYFALVDALNKATNPNSNSAQ